MINESGPDYRGQNSQDHVPQIPFWKFPIEFQFYFREKDLEEYLGAAREAYLRKVGRPATLRDLANQFGFYDNSPYMTICGDKERRGSRRDDIVRMPLKIFETVKKELDVDYHELQDSIKKYSMCKSGSGGIIPELSVGSYSEKKHYRKLPVRFTPDLAMALSAVMWRGNASGNLFFDSDDDRSDRERQGWLHRTFRDHFGDINGGKTEDGQRYIPPRAVTEIGIGFMDHQLFNRKTKLGSDHYLGIVLGSLAAGRSGNRKNVRFYLREYRMPMDRLERALCELEISHSEIKDNEIGIPENGIVKLDSLAKDFLAREELKNGLSRSDLLSEVMSDLERLSGNVK